MSEPEAMGEGGQVTEPKDEGACVATFGCHRRATHGFICAGHFERLGVMLRDIEDEGAILSAVPSMASRPGKGGGKLASERSPARLDVLVHTDRRRGTGKSETEDDALAAGDTLPILDVLHSWARVVREERGFANREAVTISGERDLLTRQLEHIAEQAWVDECYGDLARLLGQLRAANGTNALRKKSVGICPTLYAEGECGGKLWPKEEDGEVTCDLCGRIFGPAELRHLGDILIRQGYVEVFRAEWYTGVPAGTIRRWVAEKRCTSEKDGKKLMVQIGEVEQLRDRNKPKGVAS